MDAILHGLLTLDKITWQRIPTNRKPPFLFSLLKHFEFQIKRALQYMILTYKQMKKRIRIHITDDKTNTSLDICVHLIKPLILDNI